MSTSIKKSTSTYDIGDPRSYNPNDQNTNYQEKYKVSNEAALDTSQFETGGKKDLDITEQEKVVIQDIRIEYQKRLDNLDSFLTKHYALFQHKVYKCMLHRCYQDTAKDRTHIAHCQQMCYSGVDKVQAFVQKQVNGMKDSLVTCIDNSQKPQKDLVHEHFMCYHHFFKGIDQVKKEINIEFSYYS